jgi:NAD(P)-dependent dehydrogenase (short-subunit alcohol dehydrogenase family)
MPHELAGKVAIVTGGAKGIGREAAQLFAQEGAKVVIADVNMQAADLAAGLGDAVRFKRTDMGSAEEVQSLVDYAVSEFGGLHVMYNNAGVSSVMTRLLDDDLKDFHRVMSTNVLGTILGTQRAARYMAKHGGGSIITTSSTAGVLASFGQTCYRASKAAIAQFTKAAAIELAEHRIRVNCILPGQIETGIVGAALGAQMTPEKIDELERKIREVMLSSQPLKRRGAPSDVAQAALYLASDRAAYITGMLWPVDGGITCGDPVNHVERILRARAEVLRE